MRQIIALSGLLLWLASCNKESSDVSIQPGTYTGTFQRQSSTGGAVSNVSISFTSNIYAGQNSSIARYPAICNGAYRPSGADSLIFENACMWTADFDWTLILSGSYKADVSGKHLTLTRTYTTGSKDVYRLERQ